MNEHISFSIPHQAFDSELPIWWTPFVYDVLQQFPDIAGNYIWETPVVNAVNQIVEKYNARYSVIEESNDDDSVCKLIFNTAEGYTMFKLKYGSLPNRYIIKIQVGSDGPLCWRNFRTELYNLFPYVRKYPPGGFIIVANRVLAEFNAKFVLNEEFNMPNYAEIIFDTEEDYVMFKLTYG